MALNQDMYRELVNLAEQEQMQADTIAYLAEHLGRFVEPGERVLICFPTHEKGNLSWLMEQAVLKCGGRGVVWGEDHRWKTLLRLAFTSRASTIIGTPLLLLGLSKLKRANDTPLNIQHVVTAGYPCERWLLDGINRGYDCVSHSCFSLDLTGVVMGFSCAAGRDILLRQDAYSLTVTDEQGNCLPEGEVGTWRLSPKNHPELTFCSREYARLKTGDDGNIRIQPVHYVRAEDPELADLGKYLLSWTSVLDCGLCRGPYGLEVELVIFPGEKLPKLPTCARQVVRPWKPNTDLPFLEQPWRKNEADFAQTH